MMKPRAAAPRRAKAQRPTERRDDPRRIADMIELATQAKRTADDLGERFLAYLLAIVIQEMSHIESRRANAGAAEQEHPSGTDVPIGSD